VQEVMEAHSEQQDISIGFSQLDETVQPQNTNFVIQVFPDVHNKQTQAAIAPEVTHCGKNKEMLAICYCNVNWL